MDQNVYQTQKQHQLRHQVARISDRLPLKGVVCPKTDTP